MEGFEFTPELGLLAGGVTGLILGWVLGFFDSNTRTAKKIRQAEESAEAAIKEAKDRIAKAEAQRVSTLTQADDPGLLRLKNDSGYVTLELDGAPVNTATLSADQRKRLIEMLNVMRPWLEGRPSAPPPLPPQPRPAPPPPPAATPKPVAAATSAAKPDGKDERPSPPANSIVGQIDFILQEQLQGTPLETRGIYLSESPEGGVLVNIGLQKFNGVDDVPDPEIKAALRAAINAWENKYTPGLPK